MKRFLSAPAYLVWLAAALIVFVCSFATTESVDVHLHDTYFVLANRHVLQALAAGLLLYAILYRTLREVLFSPVLNAVHILFTLLPLVFVACPASGEEGIESAPRRYEDYSAWENYHSFSGLNGAVALVVVLCMFSQVIFLGHILWGLLRLFRRRR